MAGQFWLMLNTAMRWSYLKQWFNIDTCFCQLLQSFLIKSDSVVRQSQRESLHLGLLQFHIWCPASDQFLTHRVQIGITETEFGSLFWPRLSDQSCCQYWFSLWLSLAIQLHFPACSHTSYLRLPWLKNISTPPRLLAHKKMSSGWCKGWVLEIASLDTQVERSTEVHN